MLAHFNSVVIKQQFFSKCVAIQCYINFLVNSWNELDENGQAALAAYQTFFSQVYIL